MPISTITLNNGTQVQVQPDASGNLTDKGVNQNSNYQGLYNPDGSQQNPVSSSTGIRADYTALGNDINTYANTTGLTATNDANTKLLNDRMTQLKEQQDAAIAQIKSDYTVADATQTARQNKDYGGTSTNLITSGGGFLGYTGSQAGVLQSLKNTFETEKTALLSKRDAAISQAKNAYDDKQFALAQSLIKEAKDSEQELYQRQKDYNAQQLNLAQEARSADTYQRTFADDKAKAYALLSDADFAKLTPAQKQSVDGFFAPGYVYALRKTTQETASSAVQSLASKYPSAGIVASDTFDSAQTKIRNSKEYKNDMEKVNLDLQNTRLLIQEKNQNNAIITQLKTGTDGYVDPNEYVKVRSTAKMSPTEFDGRYGYLVNPLSRVKVGIPTSVAGETGALSPADMTKGTNYILNNKGTQDDLDKFQVDRAFQAWVLSKTQ